MKPNRLMATLAALAVALLAAKLWLPHSDRSPDFLPVTKFPELIPERTDAFGEKLELDESDVAAPSAPSRAPKPKAGEEPQVAHSPERPTSGKAVLITAELKGRPIAQGDLTLEYQVVDPGKYIALNESKFQKQWDQLPMNDKGQNGDSTAGDGVFSVELPSNLQKHRRLVRYRVWSAAGQRVVAPHEGDRQPNYAYFVYDGVPPWKGAIDPKSRDRRLRQVVTYPSAALERVPVYHFISSKSAVENVTWKERGNFGRANRNEYRYTGTMVYDGIVYDHIGFRARGGGWRHAMGKNMWKFNFLPGHRFEARDHYGNRYNAKWDKLNLGACIQQGDYGMRGEQGMFEAVGFRLFNLAGVEASRTHWVHLRIIDEAEEAPADQYGGDFWGLYLAVENVDDHFLKEHELPKGNLYKMEFGAKTAYNGDPSIRNQADVNSFMRALMHRQHPEAWWRENVDLGRYYSYRAILECIHHYDIDAGKNYFYYFNRASRKWIVIPWDIDLSWGDHMYGGGREPFYRAGVFSIPALRDEYQDRLAELRDLLFIPEQIGQLIDEHAAMISDPRGGPSLVDADRAKWDYNPILSSRYVMESKAGRGQFYFGNPHNDFQSMVTYMKSYATKRAAWIDARLLSGYNRVDPPTISGPGKLEFSGQSVAFRVAAPRAPIKDCHWRLAAVSNPDSPAFQPDKPWKYEVQSLWEKHVADGLAVELPTALLATGQTYRVRARWQDRAGGWSRWSKPAQFTVPVR